MTLDELIKAGVEEGIAKTIIAERDGLANDLDTANTTIKNLNAQVNDRDQKIIDLGKEEVDEDTKTKIENLIKDNKEQKEKYENDLATLSREAAIKLQLVGKVNDPDDIIPKLDQDAIKIKDGKVVDGLDAQLNTLKESKPYYFISDSAETTTDKAATPVVKGVTPADNNDVASEAPTNLGKKLAASKIAGTQATQKAATDFYFGN